MAINPLFSQPSRKIGCKKEQGTRCGEVGGGGGHAMPRKGGKRCEIPAQAPAKETGQFRKLILVVRLGITFGKANAET